MMDKLICLLYLELLEDNKFLLNSLILFIIIKHLGVSYNGSTMVSKTTNAGSIPVTPAIDQLGDSNIQSGRFLNN